MTQPGDRLRNALAGLFDAKRMERIVDPVIADLQTEYAAATRQGRFWTRRWRLCAGYFAVFKVVALCGLEQSMQKRHDRKSEDRIALVRTLWFSAAAIAAVTLLLEFPPLLQGRTAEWRVFVYLIPQALSLAIPAGLMLSILVGLGAPPVSPGLRAAILGMAIVFAVASFGNAGWLTPMVNQAFRVSAGMRDVPRGASELTLGEVGRQIDLARAGTLSTAETPALGYDLPYIEYLYHFIWALPCAVIVLAAFALSLVSRFSIRRGGRLALGGSVLFVYYVLTYAGRRFGLDGDLPMLVAAWLPNAVTALAFIAVTTVGVRRPSSHPRSRSSARI